MQDFTAAGNEESKGPFTEKHLVARALGLLPPGSRSLRRLGFNPRGSKDAAADTDCEDEMANVLGLQSADVQDSPASAMVSHAYKPAGGVINPFSVSVAVLLLALSLHP